MCTSYHFTRSNGQALNPTTLTIKYCKQAPDQ
jgi:hypothetical protein